ncbi:DUF3306 domain-containing protein [Shewanella amazonensis]|uniref:DUF3306 domain-containing protein n=1 Tax=Shewanella amazonensis (strain ATCC BAA-1098 / SB2B) TaxID=326297 RepID=A1SBR3_SHEAM|nr:DUF3306 domain-containing protein [Shewanella amazonensis]ABM01820.1 conserved hypothetical protein [Shewanella amazonensis SB2B]
MSDTSRGFLGRWQARREAVAAEEAAELANTQELTDASITAPEVLPTADAALTDAPKVADTPADLSAEVEADGAAEVPAEPLPDPDSIEVGGSFARFMSTDVDPLTRTAALRALWKQPQYNHIDGLIEYALDYSNQPKLSADASMELAKKVFRHVMEATTEEEEPQVAATSAPRGEVLADAEDNLPEEPEQLSQNDLEEVTEAESPVAQGQFNRV